jgi:hypothetical protein
VGILCQFVVLAVSFTRAQHGRSPEQTIGAAATKDVLDFTIEIGADRLANAAADDHDVLNEPQLSEHPFELSSDLRQLFLVAPEQRDGFVSRLVFGQGSTPIRISSPSTRATVVCQPVST